MNDWIIPSFLKSLNGSLYGINENLVTYVVLSINFVPKEYTIYTTTYDTPNYIFEVNWCPLYVSI